MLIQLLKNIFPFGKKPTINNCSRFDSLLESKNPLEKKVEVTKEEFLTIIQDKLKEVGIEVNSLVSYEGPFKRLVGNYEVILESDEAESVIIEAIDYIDSTINIGDDWMNSDWHQLFTYEKEIMIKKDVVETLRYELNETIILKNTLLCTEFIEKSVEKINLTNQSMIENLIEVIPKDIKIKRELLKSGIEELQKNLPQTNYDLKCLYDLIQMILINPEFKNITNQTDQISPLMLDYIQLMADKSPASPYAITFWSILLCYWFDDDDITKKVEKLDLIKENSNFFIDAALSQLKSDLIDLFFGLYDREAVRDVSSAKKFFQQLNSRGDRDCISSQTINHMKYELAHILFS